MQENSVTVSQLNAHVKALLAQESMLRSIRVHGEISGFKRHTSGHLYFTLKDQDAQVRCVMFRSAAQSLRFVPKDGMQVQVLAEAGFYVQGGQFQLYVQAMQPQGEGDLYRKFLLLKAKLEEKGYFSAERKRRVPFLPSCVGVITSGTGAALQDILQIIGRRFPAMHVQVCSVRVQGEGAAREIAAAIRYMNAHSSASVLIVGRGGGSMEDLWAFNEERVALAIYESRIPVISAVGHETDYTIADFVADLRAPTPSAAAELCVPEYAQLMQQVDMLVQKLPAAVGGGLQKRREYIGMLLQRRGFAAAEHRLESGRQRAEGLLAGLAACSQSRLIAARAALEQQQIRLEALSPGAQLRRGYAILSNEAGDVLHSVRKLKKGMPVVLSMADGTARATIESKQLRKEEQA